MRRRRTKTVGPVLSVGLLTASAMLVALNVGTSEALGCDDSHRSPDPDPIDSPGIEWPVNSQPWFTTPCGETPSCSLYADSGLTIPVVSETIYEECSDDEGIVRLVPQRLTPGVIYYIECDDLHYDAYGEMVDEPRSFKVRDDSFPAHRLGLDSVTPRNERDDSDGCGGGWGKDHLSLHLEVDGSAAVFTGEGGAVTAEFSDGSFFVERLPDSGLLTFPDKEEVDVTVTLISADGQRVARTVRSEDFERDLAYVPCSVSGETPDISSLWLLLPLFWLRRWCARGEVCR